MRLGQGCEYVKLDQGAAGQDTILAAVTGKRIALYGGWGNLTASGSVKFQSNNTDLTGAVSCGSSNCGNILPQPTEDSLPMCITAVGEALKLTSVTGKFAGVLICKVIP